MATRPNEAATAKPRARNAGQRTPDPILTPDEAATYTGMSVDTLAWYRTKDNGADELGVPRVGPPYVRRGLRFVGYRLSELDAWMERERG